MSGTGEVQWEAGVVGGRGHSGRRVGCPGLIEGAG